MYVISGLYVFLFFFFDSSPLQFVLSYSGLFAFILFLNYFLYVCLLCNERERKDVDLGVWGGGDDLKELEEGKHRIYCMTICIFQIYFQSLFYIFKYLFKEMNKRLCFLRNS